MTRNMYPVPLESVNAAYDGSIAVDIGDLLYHDTNDAKPASSQADQASEAANQALFAPRFLGVARERKLVTDGAGDIEAAIDWIGEMPCASSTFEVGDKVSIDNNDTDDGLEDQRLTKTTNAAVAIGTVLKRYAAATTTVFVRLTSNVIPPQQPATGAVSTTTIIASTSVTTPVVVFSGASGTPEIRLTTDLADALSIEDSVGDLIKFDTRTGAQVITVTPALVVTGLITSNGGLTLSGAVDLTFSGTTGQPEVMLTANLADALSIKDSTGDLMVFTTTTGALAIASAAAWTHTGNVTLSGAVDLIFSGTTGQPEIVLTTDLADALSIKDSAADIIVVTTTTGSPKVAITPNTTIAGTLGVTGVVTATGGIVVPGAVDLAFTGTTGQPEIIIPDNLADALSIKDGTGGADLLVFTTTNGSECIASAVKLTTTDGVASGTAKRVGGLSYCQVAAGTAHTNSTDEAVLGAFDIPANTIKQGTVVKVRYQGIATATNSTDTLTVVLRCGPTTLIGQALITHAATDVADGDIFEGEFTLVGRAAAGAAAACVGVGSFSGLGAAGTPTRHAAYLATTNFATNGVLKMEVTADWSVANAGNSCRLDVLTVEVI